MPVDLLTNQRDSKPLTSLEALSPAADRDDTLVAAAKGGDRHAFDKLVDRHKRKIFLLAKRITRSREDAEEVVQDAFVRAFVHLERFNGDSRFSTWLTRIAVNQALMMLRKRRQSHEISLDDQAKDDDLPSPREIADDRRNPEQDCARQELLRILGDAVAQLRPSLRTAVELRELQELTTEEAAQILGLTGSALKSRLFHARSQLRRVFDPHLEHRVDRAVRSGWKLPPSQTAAPYGN